ncbi:hypothetical protein, partial [Lacimicrobium alkaliphilum]|uniref:hypothetical protein n=1 Tax=Lacimicrobium alkaliphilum TaxID=1526571 RepID=UPI001E4F2378
VNSDSGDHQKVFTFSPEKVFTLRQNRCSSSTRMGVQDQAEYASSPSLIPLCDQYPVIYTEKVGSDPV